MKTLLLLVLLVIAPAALGAEFDYAAYKDSSIAAAGSNLGIDPRADYWLDAAHARYHTVGAFTGKIRPLQPGTRSLLQKWAKAMGHGQDTAALFASEIEVRQDGVTYWLPIQQMLVEPLQREVAPGSRAHLYILLVGAYEQVPVFAVSEFDAAEG
jgi:hypothetical protein